MTDSTHVLLPGSSLPPVAGSTDIGPMSPTETIGLTLVLRRHEPLPERFVSGEDTVPPTDFLTRYGADPADIELVTSTLTAAGAQIVGQHIPSRRVQAQVSASVAQELFHTELRAMRAADPVTGNNVEFHVHVGDVHLPAALGGVVIGVLGLDTRPVARPHVQTAVTPAASYVPTQLVTAYAFPTGDGSGQTAAILEFGGGFSPDDLSSFFTSAGIDAPSVSAVSVDGAQNNPGSDGATIETTLDIEVLGSMANHATQLVYFAPNTEQGFIDAISQAVHATPTPTVVSISWGGPEETWSAQGRQSIDSAFSDGAALGVTVSVAAGDGGSSDGETDGANHVDYPAASPYALGVGGTTLYLDSSGAIQSETVWNNGPSSATGGGVSTLYPVPSWQATVGVPGSGRGVPDVAADADPQTGYQIFVQGSSQVVGGTSASAPLWAGLICRLSQDLGHKQGLIQTAIYKGVTQGQPAPGFRDITQGNNGAFSAGPGWDACTGLGTPVGTALLKVLGG
ncbi:S8 family serine peptidase [Nocardia terpenica]|uniref:S8 family serine peptidase n=2 Tax=Nocardia terpenica TaxID=455432 RepID=A0A6G9ZC43_9NOCA|nr:S8 family serine peptidase [Nocardia terpenica]